MAQRIERLLYVHTGDPGKAGAAIRACDGVLHFNSEGSGLLHIDEGPEAAEPQPDLTTARGVRIEMQRASQIDPMLAELVGGEVPCIIARGNGGRSAIVVRRNAVRRCLGTASDLRGKVRFGAARIGWEL